MQHGSRLCRIVDMRQNQAAVHLTTAYAAWVFVSMKHPLSPEWYIMFNLKKYVENLQKIAENEAMPYEKRVEAVAERIVLENGYTNDNHNRTDSAVDTGSDADSRLGS